MWLPGCIRTGRRSWLKDIRLHRNSNHDIRFPFFVSNQHVPGTVCFQCYQRNRSYRVQQGTKLLCTAPHLAASLSHRRCANVHRKLATTAFLKNLEIYPLKYSRLKNVDGVLDPRKPSNAGRYWDSILGMYTISAERSLVSDLSYFFQACHVSLAHRISSHCLIFSVTTAVAKLISLFRKTKANTVSI